MIGIYGGTFDPFHNGHLTMATEVRSALKLDVLQVVPSARPPHRQAPVADSSMRLRMARAALEGCDRIRVDDRELRRPGVSYTVDTLLSFRDQLGSEPLCLILGQDAFIGLPSWNRWRKVLDLAHLIVLKRPSTDVLPDGGLSQQLAGRWSTSRAELASAPAGRVLELTLSQIPVSSTEIRARIGRGDPIETLVPAATATLIRQHGLYGAAT